MNRLLALVIFAGIAAGYTCAQSTPPPPVDSNVVLKVALATDQREFRPGETIPLQLSFTSSVKKQYQVNMAQYDRSGRTSLEEFNIEPSEGWADPLPNFGGSLGGLTTYQFLTAEPSTIKLNLNEWVRFTQPGEYRLSISSTRVEVRNPTSPAGTSAVTARSNEITLKIVKADPAWQKRVLTDAIAKLDATQANQSDQYAIHRQALETLRFLGTAESTRELVKRMRGASPGNLDYVCMLGIISSPERSVARTALEEALADPDRPIDSNFVHTLSKVISDNSGNYADWRAARQRVIEQLVVALPVKRGKARSTSLSTALNEAWNLNALPQQTIEKLMVELVSVFDKLPLDEQNMLLSSRWDYIKSPAWLPIVKRYAQAYSDSPGIRLAPNYALRDLNSSALRRWYELDPAGARPAIIAEITRPRPRFGARILGLLPDKTLPEVDFALVENFSSTDDYDGKGNIASLIARYATDAILPQVIDAVAPKIGMWACDIQNPLLAYVLRVNPTSARPLIEKAVAARGDGFSACNQGLYVAVSETHYDPILEDLAIESLNDPDPQVVQGAASMLGNFGSPAAESALLKRYASWAEQWAGHEAELNQMFADGLNNDSYQLGLGQVLVQAIATGRAWLTDKAALQRLGQQTKVRRVRQMFDDYLKRWEDEPLRMFIDASYSRFHASVGQYQFQSPDALKEKLAQFAPGTKFVITLPTMDPSSSEAAAAEIRSFLTSHGMSVADRKPVN